MNKIALTTSALIALYNPANAANLTDEEVANLALLDQPEINALATAYPNTAQLNNYLVLFDKRLPADKQVYQFSSWQNLKDLLSYGQAHFSAHDFRGRQGSATNRQASVSTATPAPSTTVDLSPDDAANAEGLKREGEAIDVQSDGVNKETVAGTTGGVVRELHQDVPNGLNAELQNSQPSTDPTLSGEILAPGTPSKETVAGTTNLTEANVVGEGSTAATDAINRTEKTELEKAEDELEQLKKDGAHPNTIKAKEKQIAALRAK